VTKRWVVISACVAARGLLVLFGGVLGYVSAIVIAFPLSVVANFAAYYVIVVTLAEPDSNGLPVAALFMSVAAAVQVLAVCAMRALWRRRGSLRLPGSDGV
jgi:hypothetical protein